MSNKFYYSFMEFFELNFFSSAVSVHIDLLAREIPDLEHSYLNQNLNTVQRGQAKNNNCEQVHAELAFDR